MLIRVGHASDGCSNKYVQSRDGKCIEGALGLEDTGIISKTDFDDLLHRSASPEKCSRGSLARQAGSFAPSA